MEFEIKVMWGTLFAAIVFSIFYVLTIQTHTYYYPLATQQELNAEMLNVSTERSVSGGLVQQTTDSINFMIQEGTSKVSKTINYQGDVRYESSSRNEIRYTEKKDIFGQTIIVEDVVVTYDENLFEMN